MTPLSLTGTQRRFGTFLGVFTPSVLTILGVIMYLRFGWVVAHAGLGGTLLIVGICSAVALVTALSASAVATNMIVGTGGEYYLISRSLGLTFGGAIGIPLFLCRAISVTLYCFGLAEAVVVFWPEAWGQPQVQWLAAGLIMVVTVVAGRSAAVSLKLQVPLMGLVGLSLAALTMGVFTGPLKPPQWQGGLTGPGASPGFWVVLAVFFPAVTGFAAGIGMSGDLKDPQRSIPRGTLLAVAAGAVVYLTVPVLLACTGRVTPAELADIRPEAPPVWTRIAALGGILVYPGMWAAILSSAFGSALAAPRVLQALGRDRLAPGFLARASRTGQPTVAAWVTGLIALSAVALGDLNAVARMVTIFFLTLYMSLNLVTATESIVRDPSWRPRLKVHWSVCLAGALGCLAVMFLISPPACLAAIGLELLIYLYLRRKALQASWGDVWAGVWGSLARQSIYRLAQTRREPRSWRPYILLFADRIEERTGLVRLAAALNQNHGVLTVCDVLTGRLEEQVPAARQREAQMSDFLQREGVLAFPEADIVEDFERGVMDIIQANGMGGLRCNTVAFGWPTRPERLASLLRVIRMVEKVDKAALIVRPGPTDQACNYRRVDVWWRGRHNNGDLMLLLAHLLTLNAVWRRAEINVRSIVTSEAGRLDSGKALDDLIRSVRIRASRDVIVLPENQSVVQTMHQASRDADVVFLGLMSPREGQEDEYARRVTEIVAPLPMTILVRNSGPFAGRLI